MTDSNLNFNDKWSEYYAKVYGYFYKRVNNKMEVEDLTANTMTTAFMADGVINFKAYLWKVAHNYLVKYINTKTTSPQIVSFDENIDFWQPDIIEYQISDLKTPQYKLRTATLLNCVQENTPKESEFRMLQLSIIDELNSTQIGRIMDLKPDTVRQKLSRLIKRIKNSCTNLWSDDC